MRTAATLALPVSARDHIDGPAYAPVTLLEYGDYECPYCGQAYVILQELKEVFGEQLRMVFRHFPLATLHPHAQPAAEAAEAAGAQGQFWEMHGMLFENQQALEDEDLYEYAADLGLESGAVQSRYGRAPARRTDSGRRRQRNTERSQRDADILHQRCPVRWSLRREFSGCGHRDGGRGEDESNIMTHVSARSRC